MTPWIIGGCIVGLLLMGLVLLLVVAGGTRLGRDESDVVDG